VAPTDTFEMKGDAIHTHLGIMKKKKSSKRKNTKRRSNPKPAESIAREREMGRKEVSEGKDLTKPPLKREVSRKADDEGFALKRYFNIARQFLSDAKMELKKVTWPNRKELLSTTAIVIVLVLLIAFFLGIVDLGLVKIIKNVIR
jgi:preprotein translocase subunit SecE